VSPISKLVKLDSLGRLRSVLFWSRRRWAATQQTGHTMAPLHFDECHTWAGCPFFYVLKHPKTVRPLTVYVYERASKLGQAMVNKLLYGAYIWSIYSIFPPADSLFHCMDMPLPPTKLQLLPPIHRVSVKKEPSQPKTTDTR